MSPFFIVTMKINVNNIKTIVISIVVLIVGLSLLATLLPTAQSTGDLMSDSTRCSDAGGYWNSASSACQVNSTNTTLVPYNSTPFSGFFGTGGLTFVVIMAGFLLVVILSYVPSNSSRRR